MRTVAARHEDGIVAWRGTLSAFCATLIGIGLSRFAYSPLIPPLISEGWFTPAAAAYLGAANLAGYLFGALSASRISTLLPTTWFLRGMMLLAAASFFACAVPTSFPWFFVWRLASGWAGGTLMVLAAPSVLARVPAPRRGLVSGIMFSGVGTGIAMSGLLVPPLLQFGLTQTWLALGLMCLAFTLVAWGGWPSHMPSQSAMDPASSRRFIPREGRVALYLVYLQYGLIAVGLVPHMVFLVDFVARGLGAGVDSGARYWILFGIGAVLGPIMAGRVADRVGFRTVLKYGLAVQAACIAWLAVLPDTIGLIVSSIVVGAAVTGNVPLVLGRTQEIVSDPLARKKAWGAATAVFALGQAGGGYGFSFLYAISAGHHQLLFALGAGAVTLALLIDLIVDASTRGRAERLS